MGKAALTNKKMQAVQKTKKYTFVAVGVIAVLIIGFIIIKLSTSGEDTTGAASGDLKILKSEITETAKFYSYKTGKTNMEVLAVKASDGTIRTAFNTCQICYDSGRGYYEQQGEELVCQNCGNRFHIDQIEKIRGGCNPAPIVKENRAEDDEFIVISQDFMEEYKGLFGNWRK